MTSSQSGGLSNLPRLGFSFPERIFKAVDLPIPLATDETQDISRAGHRETMELEASPARQYAAGGVGTSTDNSRVGTIAMCHLGLQVGGKIASRTGQY